MGEMSVSMILKLVDQVSRPAREAESALEKLKSSSQALNDIRSGSASSTASAIVAANEKIAASEGRNSCGDRKIGGRAERRDRRARKAAREMDAASRAGGRGNRDHRGQ